MQVNLAATALTALGIDPSSRAAVQPTDVATVAATEAAAMSVPSKEEQKLDSALASALSALMTQVAASSPKQTEAAAVQPIVPETEAAKTPSATSVALDTKSDLASVGTTAAGTPVAEPQQPLETSVREVSTVPPHDSDAPDSPLPAFEPKPTEGKAASETSADTDLSAIAERFAKEVASRLEKASPTREKAPAERPPDKTQAAENLPPTLKRLLSHLPSEVRELFTTLRGMSQRMLRDGASFNEVAAAFRAALKSTVRYAHTIEVATQVRSRPDVANSATTAAHAASEAANQTARSTEAADNPLAGIFSKRGEKISPKAPTAVGDVAPTTAKTEAAKAPEVITDVRTLRLQELASEVGHIGRDGQGREDGAVKPATKTEAADAHGAPFSVRDLPSHTQPDTVAKASTEARFQEVATKVLEQASELAAQGGKRTLTVRLDPPELGTVDITIHSRGSKVEAHIVATNSEVRFAVEGNRQALTEALARHGLELSSLLVGSDRPGGGSSRHTEAAFQPPAYRFEAEAALTEAVSRSAARWAWQVGALDYVI